MALTTTRRNSPKRARGAAPDGVWAIVALDSDREGWQLLLRIVDDDGRAAIAELHLIAGAHPDAHTEDWIELTTPAGARKLLDSSARYPLPPGGISQQLLRDIRLSQALARISAALTTTNPATAQTILEGNLLGKHGLTRQTLAKPGDPDHRRPRTDLELVIVATAYLDAIQTASKHPRRDTAKALGPGWTEHRVRDHLHRARTRDLLTDAPHGHPGGNLTPKAKRLLHAHTHQTRRRPPR